MSDYYAESPLWANNVMIDPERLALSAELSAGLLAWQAHFVEHFHHEAGWDTTADPSTDSGRSVRVGATGRGVSGAAKDLEEVSASPHWIRRPRRSRRK